MLFICSAYAADAPTGGGGGGYMSFLPMLAFIAILYFLLIRPQQKRAKQHKAMVCGLKKSDKVLTAGGVYGTVSKVINDNEVILELAEGVYCKFLKSSITAILTNKVEISTGPIAVNDNDAKK